MGILSKTYNRQPVCVVEIGREADQGHNGRDLMEDEKRDNMAYGCIPQPVRVPS